MRLIQSMGEEYPAQLLPNWDGNMETGYMTECVSVIVMCNPKVNGKYQQMRGYHGGGGVEAVNFRNLFKDIPNSSDTRIIVIAGVLRNTLNDARSIKKHVEKQIKKHDLALAKQFYLRGSDVTVTRYSQIDGTNLSKLFT